MLWGKVSGAPATEIDKDVAPITDKQTKPRIIDSDQKVEKREVEIVDAEQSSSDVGKQHMMEDTTSRERDDTSLQTGRWIDVGTDWCVDFSEGSLDQSMLCMDVGSCREL